MCAYGLLFAFLAFFERKGRPATRAERVLCFIMGVGFAAMAIYAP